MAREQADLKLKAERLRKEEELRAQKQREQEELERLQREHEVKEQAKKEAILKKQAEKSKQLQNIKVGGVKKKTSHKQQAFSCVLSSFV